MLSLSDKNQAGVKGSTYARKQISRVDSIKYHT